MNLALVDHLIVAAYLIVLFVLGLSFAKKSLDDDNYLLAARKLTLPMFVMTLVTTWYGAILGVGEFVHGFGFVGWVVNGLLWYLVYLVFGLFLAKKIHESNLTTVAEQFNKRIGKKSGKIAAVMTFIMSSPAPYVLSLAVFLNYIYGISTVLSVALGIIVSAVYIWFGGFKAVVRTDVFQFVLMFLGFGALLALSVVQFGGFDFIQANVPESHLTFKGELSWQTITVWGFLALWTFVDPNFYQRCYAAKTGSVAQKGVFVSILFWIVFDLLTLATGLYARAAFPEAEPMFSYLVLADGVMPIVVKGVFLTAILAIIMSTIDSFLFASSSIISNDFLKKEGKKQSMKTLTRIGILITLALSLVLIVVFESIIGIIYAVGTVGVAALLLPLLFAMFGKKKLISDNQAAVGMILTAILASAWLVEGWINAEYGWPVYRWGVEPMYIGLGASIVIYAATIIFSKTRQLKIS